MKQANEPKTENEGRKEEGQRNKKGRIHRSVERKRRVGVGGQGVRGGREEKRGMEKGKVDDVFQRFPPLDTFGSR